MAYPCRGPSASAVRTRNDNSVILTKCDYTQSATVSAGRPPPPALRCGPRAGDWGGTMRIRLARAALAGIAAGALGLGAACAPPTPTPAPSVTVSPGTGLVDGQQVTVSGSG